MKCLVVDRNGVRVHRSYRSMMEVLEIGQECIFVCENGLEWVKFLVGHWYKMCGYIG